MSQSLDQQAFERLIAGLRAGQEQAATEFYTRFCPLLEGLAARHLASAVQRRVGPDDVVNSACRTFLRRVHRGQFELHARDQLWNLLCAITLAKARKKVRFHLADRRSVGREERPAPGNDDVSAPDRPVAGPSPAEAAAFADQFRMLLDRLDEEERRMVLLKLENRTHEEIAATLSLSERTVNRILRRVEARLGEIFESES